MYTCIFKAFPQLFYMYPGAFCLLYLCQICQMTFVRCQRLQGVVIGTLSYKDKIHGTYSLCFTCKQCNAINKNKDYFSKVLCRKKVTNTIGTVSAVREEQKWHSNYFSQGTLNSIQSLASSATHCRFQTNTFIFKCQFLLLN